MIKEYFKKLDEVERRLSVSMDRDEIQTLGLKLRFYHNEVKHYQKKMQDIQSRIAEVQGKFGFRPGEVEDYNFDREFDSPAAPPPPAADPPAQEQDVVSLVSDWLNRLERKGVDPKSVLSIKGQPPETPPGSAAAQAVPQISEFEPPQLSPHSAPPAQASASSLMPDAPAPVSRTFTPARNVSNFYKKIQMGEDGSPDELAEPLVPVYDDSEISQPPGQMEATYTPPAAAPGPAGDFSPGLETPLATPQDRADTVIPDPEPQSSQVISPDPEPQSPVMPAGEITGSPEPRNPAKIEDSAILQVVRAWSREHERGELATEQFMERLDRLGVEYGEIVRDWLENVAGGDTSDLFKSNVSGTFEFAVAYILEKLGYPGAALNHVQAALEKGATIPQATLLLASLYSARGLWSPSLDYYRRYELRAGRSEHSAIGIFKALKHTGRLEDLAMESRGFTFTDPALKLEADYLKAEAFYATGNDADGGRIVTEVLASDSSPADKARFAILSARRLEQKGAAIAAVDMYEKSLEFEDSNPDVYYNIGRLYLENKALPLARNFLVTLVRRFPESQEADRARELMFREGLQ